ncbi:WD40-repeat-containing domain protein [Mycena capillaripes]|nr:WD40-repeat-containing domain protein [Mycena capillaripes]
MAGTGKSAIARSFCHMLVKDKQLGASFFCLRGDANRGNPKRILPTLALHLASEDVTYKSTLLATVDQGISPDANLKIQVENLLERPLCGADSSGRPPFVLVIDALDELNDEDATKDLLRRLVSIVPKLPIKLFVTSRPERHIRPHFDTAEDCRRVLRLHDIEHNIVTADISLYLTHHLAGIRAESSPMLPPEWANNADIEVLTHRAGKLFIYAFTAMKYISESPGDRLQTLISIKVDTEGSLTKPLDDIYRHILSNAMDMDRLKSNEVALTKQILAAILTVGQPVSVASLGGLLRVPPWQVRARLDRLHAVIHVPTDDDKGVLSTFHASFGDFLTTTGRASDEMLINPLAAHTALLSSCIQIMGSELHFNVSKCPTSYFPNTNHKLTIPALLQYVCLYWPHHISAASAADEGSITLSHLDALKDVFLPKFLFWVEVLSTINKARLISILIVTVLNAKCFAHAPTYLTEFLVDANEFVLSSLEAIETSVAHIYISALPCIQPTSRVAKAFWPKFSHIALLHLTGIQRWQKAAALILKPQAKVGCIAVSPDGTCIVSGLDNHTIQMWDARTGEAVMEPIEGHTDSVSSVMFSPDGACIVSGSHDKTICVWDARTGKALMEPIQGHTNNVQSAVFSPDGTHVTSASSDKTIRVWDAKTGKAVMEPIQGHTDEVQSVVFSPDGTHIASGSSDKTICVWDAKTGKAVMKPIKGHKDWVRSVAFSHDGARIVSSSDDKTIRVWDASTGKAIMKPINGHTDWVLSVVFSPDGAHIVSGSSDRTICTICVWDVETGKAVMEPIQGHTNYILSVAFSPDGACIASGSADKTIRIWDVRTGKAVMEPIQGHADWVCSVAFSPDGAHIISGSYDRTICVWNAKTGKAVMKPIQGHTDCVWSVAFSPDGARIASGSDDRTIRVWNAKTGKAITKPLKGHTESVRSVAFSPNGEYIVSGSDDRTICVWDARTGKAVMEPIHGHTDCVWSVAFSPDGARIASGSEDKTIHVWSLRTGITTADKFTPSTPDLSAGPITFSRTKDSWIRGPNQELIMWVPPEYRPYLHVPPWIIFISASARVVVDTSRFVHGTDWVKCYTE